MVRWFYNGRGQFFFGNGPACLFYLYTGIFLGIFMLYLLCCVYVCNGWENEHLRTITVLDVEPGIRNVMPGQTGFPLKQGTK